MTVSLLFKDFFSPYKPNAPDSLSWRKGIVDNEKVGVQ